MLKSIHLRKVMEILSVFALRIILSKEISNYIEEFLSKVMILEIIKMLDGLLYPMQIRVWSAGHHLQMCPVVSITAAPVGMWSVKIVALDAS